MEHGLRDSESSQTSEFSSSTSAKGAPTKLPFQPLQSLRHDQRTVASTKKENTAAASDITGYHQGAEEENVGAVEDYRVDVGWEGGDADPENPRSMHRGRKWLIVIILSWSSINVTCASSIYASMYEQLTAEFHCSRIVATLGLSLFVMGLGIGPMVLAPLSEFYGRRPIYLFSLLFFLVLIFPCAFAQNIETMLVFRFLDGLAGSAFLSVAGGTIGDLFSSQELQAPMLLYTASPFLGPEFGPLFGGLVNQYSTWRWTFYLLLIWAGAMLTSIFLFVPETYHPVLLQKKARRLRRESGNENLVAPMERRHLSIPKTILWSLIRPFQLLTLEPMCLLLCIFSALLLGILYLFFGTIPLVFGTNHGFNPWQNGLAFMGILVGMVFGVATGPFWDRNYQRLVEVYELQGGEFSGGEPEFRLPPAIAGGVLVPIGLFWFAWTTYPSVHWIVPIMGSVVFAMGTLLIYSGIFTFLVHAYPLYAASALAANSFVRSSFAASFPLFGVQMYEKLGYQWATSLLAFLTVLLMPFPYIFFKYGKRLRQSSRFAATGK